MKKAYYYFFVRPLQKSYIDNSNNKPTILIPIQTKKKTYELALFSNENTIHMFRILTPDLTEDKITEDDAKIIQLIKEHMLSVLRLTYDNELISFDHHIWVFREDTEPPELSILSGENINPTFRVNNENIRSTYINTFQIRNQLRLLADGQDRRIPLQYRYLSLYKLLELEFKERGAFNQEFPTFISKFEERFQKLSISKRKLENYIHEIRDKCAHIKTNKELMGVTQLDQKATLEVELFLPVLFEIVTTRLNEKYGGNGFLLTK